MADQKSDYKVWEEFNEKMGNQLSQKVRDNIGSAIMNNNGTNVVVDGVSEAPTDGRQYGRQSESWTPIVPVIPEAPQNGKLYGRQSKSWQEVVIDVKEAPKDNKEYLRKNGTWIENTDDVGVPEAPKDGKEYLRKDGTWIENTDEEGAGEVPEAPKDGKEYLRKDGGWVENVDVTGVTEAPADDKEYVRKNETWIENKPGIADAPVDGKEYLRKDGSWIENTDEEGIGEVTEAPDDGKEYVRKNKAWIENTDDTGIVDVPVDGKEYIRKDEAWVENTSIGDAPTDGKEYLRKDGTWVENIDQTGDVANVLDVRVEGVSIVEDKIANITGFATTTALGTVDGKIDTEVTNRQTAISNLEEQIEMEAEINSVAITKLTNDLTTETTAREEEDTAINGLIAAEVTARQTTDTNLGTLSTALDNEIAAREETDDSLSELSTALDNEVTARITLGTEVASNTEKISTLETGLINEATTRTEEDNKLLPKSGGTMTGDLLLAGDPVNEKSAVDKEYMERKIAEATGSALDFAGFIGTTQPTTNLRTGLVWIETDLAPGVAPSNSYNNAHPYNGSGWGLPNDIFAPTMNQQLRDTTNNETWFWAGNEWERLDFNGSTFNDDDFTTENGVLKIKDGSINDSKISSISQNKITGLTADLANKLNKSETSVENNIPAFDNTGGIVDSGVAADSVLKRDAAAADYNLPMFGPNNVLMDSAINVDESLTRLVSVTQVSSVYALVANNRREHAWRLEKNTYFINNDLPDELVEYNTHDPIIVFNLGRPGGMGAVLFTTHTGINIMRWRYAGGWYPPIRLDNQFGTFVGQTYLPAGDLNTDSYIMGLEAGMYHYDASAGTVTNPPSNAAYANVAVYKQGNTNPADTVVMWFDGGDGAGVYIYHSVGGVGSKRWTRLDNVEYVSTLPAGDILTKEYWSALQPGVYAFQDGITPTITNWPTDIGNFASIEYRGNMVGGSAIIRIVGSDNTYELQSYGQNNPLVFTKVLTEANALIGNVMGPPDTNRDSDNKITTNGGSWTLDRDGYIYAYMTATSIVPGHIYIDGKDNASTLAAYGTASLFTPLKKGTTVRILVESSFNGCGCWFYPALPAITGVPTVNNLVTIGPPDYANYVVKASAVSGGKASFSWTADADGYIRVAVDMTTAASKGGLYGTVMLRINNMPFELLYIPTTDNAGTYYSTKDNYYQIKKGDLISVAQEGTLVNWAWASNLPTIAFIPPTATPPVNLKSTPVLNYRTTEQLDQSMGLSLEGKPIYRTTFTGTNPAIGSEVSVMPQNTARRFIKMEGIATIVNYPASCMVLNAVADDVGRAIVAFADDGAGVRVKTLGGNDVAGGTFRLTVWYTK